ncbi:hypothetical protein [Streptomyces sp. SPB162]|uniref:hypothetical protein n=1 Tax=Streptomyces sp. SPB162 TaxID=2940560 RepID=UPI002A533C0E|nr:hypothetical protein [Streptomyces sp. SPB162]
MARLVELSVLEPGPCQPKGMEGTAWLIVRVLVPHGLGDRLLCGVGFSEPATGDTGVHDELGLVEILRPRWVVVGTGDLLELPVASAMAWWVAVWSLAVAWAKATRRESMDITRGVPSVGA